MKRIFFLLATTILMLVACGNTDPTESIAEQIDKQLTGTWISYDSDIVRSEYTFLDGKYVSDTYVNGEKLDNSSLGTYFVGVDAIHTVTSDQKDSVEGSIPFSFENGELKLHGANGDLVKKN